MEWNIPNTPDTKFRIGSITRQFTSMLIMQLVEQNKIDLQGKLTDYLPYYRQDTGLNHGICDAFKISIQSFFGRTS